MLRRPQRRSCRVCFALSLFAVQVGVSTVRGADPAETIDTSTGDRLIRAYFERETKMLADATFSEIRTLEDWLSRKEEYRRQLFEMLGLDPFPEKTPLQPVVTGTVEHAEFRVENLHFQSRPGLYVTGNLYLPRDPAGPAPTVLYVCGHGRVKKDGISYGNKTHYQHHGAWFARHGYVCLVIDTLQLGEIEGIHHGTYREKMWWWNSRGYTSAGVEAWNCIRALDYLQTRPEVDPSRIGVTGRSGGGAYSWWIAALDERIQAAVPVAGITTLENHVVDGCVEGHCDCMYLVNTYRWDYPLVAALVAPRPLLISNTDKDRIFPLDGVVETYVKVRKIYELFGEQDKFGLHICEGPHADTQQLRVHAFQWLNKYLKGEEPLIETPAVKLFEPEQLKVFVSLPEDEINTRIQETFIPQASDHPIPDDDVAWRQRRASWMGALREKCFRGWPEQAAPSDERGLRIQSKTRNNGLRFVAAEITSHPGYPLPVYLIHNADVRVNDVDRLVVTVLDQGDWERHLRTWKKGFPEAFGIDGTPEADQDVEDLQPFENPRHARIYFAPRGIGPTEWDRDERARTHIRRRLMLLGQTLDGMRIWDVRRLLQGLRSTPAKDIPITLRGQHAAAGWALYASLFEPEIERLELKHLSRSHAQGPILLNVLRYLDVPQAVTLACERTQVVIEQADETGWGYPGAVIKQLGWEPERLTIRAVPPTP